MTHRFQTAGLELLLKCIGQELPCFRWVTSREVDECGRTGAQVVPLGHIVPPRTMEKRKMSQDDPSFTGSESGGITVALALSAIVTFSIAGPMAQRKISSTLSGISAAQHGCRDAGRIFLAGFGRLSV